MIYKDWYLFLYSIKFKKVKKFVVFKFFFFYVCDDKFIGIIEFFCMFCVFEVFYFEFFCYEVEWGVFICDF